MVCVEQQLTTAEISALRIKSFLKAQEEVFPTERKIYVKEIQNAENMTNAGEKCKLAPRNAPPLTVCLRVTLGN